MRSSRRRQPSHPVAAVTITHFVVTRCGTSTVTTPTTVKNRFRSGSEPTQTDDKPTEATTDKCRQLCVCVHFWCWFVRPFLLVPSPSHLPTESSTVQRNTDVSAFHCFAQDRTALDCIQSQSLYVPLSLSLSFYVSVYTVEWIRNAPRSSLDNYSSFFFYYYYYFLYVFFGFRSRPPLSSSRARTSTNRSTVTSKSSSAEARTLSISPTATPPFLPIHTNHH